MVVFSVRGLASPWNSNAVILCSLVNMKMEDYEIFCKKHLCRIQEEAIKRETSFTVQQKNISLIQFHGIPVLSPLVSAFFSFPGVLTVLLALTLLPTRSDSTEGAALFEVWSGLLLSVF